MGAREGAADFILSGEPMFPTRMSAQCTAQTSEIGGCRRCTRPQRSTAWCSAARAAGGPERASVLGRLMRCAAAGAGAERDTSASAWARPRMRRTLSESAYHSAASLSNSSCICSRRGVVSPGADVGGGEPSPGADVGGGEPSPGADVGRGEPSPGAEVARGERSPGADVGRVGPSPGADVAGASGAASPRGLARGRRTRTPRRRSARSRSRGSGRG